MPKYLIERGIPEVGRFSAEQLKDVSKTSCEAIYKLGPQVQWQHSYVLNNKSYCVYIAPNEDMIREHAKLSGFPVDTIHKVSTIIDPATSE